METKLIVETPYGTVTRRSARPYAFVVVSFGQSESYLRARHEQSAAYNRKLAAKYRAVFEGRRPVDSPYLTREQFGPWAQDAEAKAAEPFKMPAATRIVHGWSQSRSGAERMAADAAKHGHLGIVVVPVE